MAISVVNGYICMNGCDAAKARTGQNPHPATSAQSGGGSNGQTNGANSNNNGNAVVYGGSLASLNGTAATSTSSPAPPSRVNVVA
jgi:hypothetical protein